LSFFKFVLFLFVYRCRSSSGCFFADNPLFFSIFEQEKVLKVIRFTSLIFHDSMSEFSFTPEPLPEIPDWQSGLAACLEAISRYRSFCLASHVNSDGDSLGSQLGLAHLLTTLGKSACLINPSPVPENLRGIPGWERIEVFDAKRHERAFANAEAIIVLDGNSPLRMRGMEAAILRSAAFKMVIDHHLAPIKFADVYAIDIDASSTAEMIYRLVGLFERRDNANYCAPDLARALYTGIMTDTGNFRFPRTNAEVHRIVARLIESGVDPSAVYDGVYSQNSLSRARLLGRALSSMEIHCAGAFCAMTITRQMMQESGLAVEHTDGFVEQTLTVRGVSVGAIFVELDDHIKISLRSKGVFPVNDIAAHFGGGGHLNAAGCRAVNIGLEEARAAVLRLVGEKIAS
jgi:phosphoesterase RecJ-like protein